MCHQQRLGAVRHKPGEDPPPNTEQNVQREEPGGQGGTLQCSDAETSYRAPELETRRGCLEKQVWLVLEKPRGEGVWRGSHSLGGHREAKIREEALGSVSRGSVWPWRCLLVNVEELKGAGVE